MKEAIAELNSYRQSPRKMRVVSDSVRGKKVEEAIMALRFLGKRAAEPLSKLIESAVSNAKQNGMDEKALWIKELRVDGGAIMYRRRSASRGRAPVIRKRTSHIKVVLSDFEKPVKKSKAKKETKKSN